MKLTSLTISGFRCFNDEGQTIALNDMNCFVGPNASGKTATLMALVRLFGEYPTQRQLTTDDFHLAGSEPLESKTERKLLIECRIDFPELSLADPTNPAIPESFNQMIVDGPGRPPFCRLRLEGTWTNNGTALGDIEQNLYWILTDSSDPNVINDGNRRRAPPNDRRRIRVIYVPATREPEKQIAITTSTAFGRLLRNLSLSGVEERLREGLTQLQNEIGNLRGVTTLNAQLQKTWTDFYKGRVARSVAFKALDENPGDLLNLLVAHFAPGEDGRSILSAGLSDGLRSLFSLSLPLALFQIEQAIAGTPQTLGFKEELVEDFPLLTLFAIEEPENHLSPHYLGSVISQLTAIAKHPNAQVLLSSHSPAILGRVQPDDVRYFLGHERVPHTRVMTLPLPTDQTDEAFKYVREAVRGFPELYFARFVVFGEGASEEIILKRLFEASGSPLDANFISIVPLGGRHVNHFWRLVASLEIPHLTLLDLDREKEGAGWGRIHYVRNQLVRHFGANSPRLQFQTSTQQTVSLADGQYDSLKTNSIDDAALLTLWMSYFRNQFHVFFASPLDIDFALLEAFPSVYKAQAEQGPRLPDRTNASAAYQTAVLDRTKQVLAADPKLAPDTTGGTYTPEQRELFPWYKYLFVDGSKPVAHMRAMIALTDAELVTGMPTFLRALVDAVKSQLSESEATNGTSRIL